MFGFRAPQSSFWQCPILSDNSSSVSSTLIPSVLNHISSSSRILAVAAPDIGNYLVHGYRLLACPCFQYCVN